MIIISVIILNIFYPVNNYNNNNNKYNNRRRRKRRRRMGFVVGVGGRLSGHKSCITDYGSLLPALYILLLHCQQALCCWNEEECILEPSFRNISRLSIPKWERVHSRTLILDVKMLFLIAYFEVMLLLLSEMSIPG